MVILEGLYGLILADGYWDYKMLAGNLFTFLMPLTIYVFSSPPLVLRRTINTWFKYALIPFSILLPIMQPEAPPGKYLVPVMFMLLFLKPLIRRQKLVILLLFLLIFVFGSLGARATVIKYLVALLMGLSMYTFIYQFKRLLKFAHMSLMVLPPLLLLILGVTGIFNVFKVEDYATGLAGLEAKSAYSEGLTEKLDADTRTFIYVETITSAIKNNYLWTGHSLARGYESPHFGHLDFYGRGERYSSEVSILNIFTYFGIFGVLIYFAIFLTASYKAVVQSNNVYIKMVGLFLAFRWVFAWVEDFSRFDLNYLFIWIAIAMCYSIPFRAMSNREFEVWVRGLLSSRKVVLQ